MFIRCKTALILPFLVLSALPLTANSIFDLLQKAAGTEPLEATLTYPVDSLHKRTLTPRKASLTFIDAAGAAQEWKLKVRVRGKSRLKSCDFPPLKFDFAKDDLRAAGLSEFDKYKVVVPCSAGPAAEAAVLREYLAYRAYQLLTPLSYRVQLLQLTRRDENGHRPDLKSLAFLIENTTEMAARNGVKELAESFQVPLTDYDPAQEATHAMFQYFIANTDWSNKLIRNVKKVRLQNGLIAPVGYDFDYSGWVSASYAAPRRHIGQAYVGDRVYLGYPQADSVLQKVIAEFTSAQADLFALAQHPLLKAKGRRVLRTSLRQFYQRLQEVTEGVDATLYGALRGEDAHLIPTGYSPEAFFYR
ncbi:MAG: hypothetical protein AAFZ52_09505 [Bacteroidota bacterium]